jgi:hypothetical protein
MIAKTRGRQARRLAPFDPSRRNCLGSSRSTAFDRLQKHMIDETDLYDMTRS